jgi:hypothetical protein
VKSQKLKDLAMTITRGKLGLGPEKHYGVVMYRFRTKLGCLFTQASVFVQASGFVQARRH